MNNNMMMLGNLLRNGGNPQQMMMSMLQSQSNNPMVSNLMSMMQRNDTKGIEQLAKNLCNANGVTPEQAIQSARKYLGM